MPTINDLKPTVLWKHFHEICRIPRCSGNEGAAGAYVLTFAKEHGFEADKDGEGNIVVRVPGSSGRENARTVVLQSHLDMVCEKNSGTKFDFDKDAIPAYIDGEWVTAKDTTLGADNGIGMAAAMAVAEDESAVHGPLELLFTTDEETGLNGAIAIRSDFLKGRILLNLDSEKEGNYSIGCAGGGDSEMTLGVSRKGEKSGLASKVTLKGLRGGHSGIDIHTGRGNAIQLLARMLFDCTADYQLASLVGGSKHNAIPREAFAMVYAPDASAFKAQMENLFRDVQYENRAVEADMRLLIEAAPDAPDPMGHTSRDAFIRLLVGLPHGVLAMSQEISGLVETSNNLAIVTDRGNEVTVYTSTRSSIMSALEAVRKKIEAIALLAGARITHLNGYPAWTPNLDSPILKTMREVYKNTFRNEPKVEAIHAGLECGIIGEKFHGMDMISFGPDLKNPHSPDEKVHIASVGRFYHLLKETLKVLAE